MGAAVRSGATEPPHGVLPHCPDASGAALCAQVWRPARLALGCDSNQSSPLESYPMSYDPERRKAFFADPPDASPLDRSPEQLNRLAETDARHARQVVTPARTALLTKNRLLLLIAGLAFLVAIGVVTN
jgi:hypothetical protein